jgi:hypothetical protein
MWARSLTTRTGGMGIRSRELNLREPAVSRPDRFNLDRPCKPAGLAAPAP